MTDAETFAQVAETIARRFIRSEQGRWETEAARFRDRSGSPYVEGPRPGGVSKPPASRKLAAPKPPPS